MAELPEPGRVLGGRFTLGGLLGEGAMGAVYQAVDATTGAEVAVKVLRRSLAGEASLRRRFRREAAVLETLSHPSIVRTLAAGAGDEGEPPFLAMERLRGETLGQAIARGGPWAPAALTPVVEGLVGALAAAHAVGIVHGDVKPENVFLLAGGGAPAVKLVDFGLAKVEGLERLTRTGEIGGTPAYLAPEVVTGEAPLGPKADVYGLGVTLFEALAGRPAFEGRNPGKLLFAVASGNHPDLGVLAPHLPEPVVTVVARAMATSPARRLADARALGDAWAAATVALPGGRF